jgi:hypothetical protein
MLRFERVLTAPTRAELERTLSEAAEAAGWAAVNAYDLEDEPLLAVLTARRTEGVA